MDLGRPRRPKTHMGRPEPSLLRSNITRAQVGMMDLAIFEFRRRPVKFL